ncbi:MAG: DNA repair protein RecO [Clostridia bacterium]|nr:DNA repair protein RecO [Clostridia bacterium]
MEFKTDALVLRAVDYGENDKVVTLLTADRGKIAAGMKGVKKAGAKLKFAAQPFCFAEYVLTARGERNTVISAALHDGFYPLRERLDAYYAAVCVLEACDRLMLGETAEADSKGLLLAAVRALSEIATGDDAAFSLVRFLTEALALAGFPLRADTCAVCGKPLGAKLNFDFSDGAFCCSECGGAAASRSTYLTIRAALGLSGERSADGERRALRLLRAYFNAQTDSDIPSLGEFVSTFLNG